MQTGRIRPDKFDMEPTNNVNFVPGQAVPRNPQGSSLRLFFAAIALAPGLPALIYLLVGPQPLALAAAAVVYISAATVAAAVVARAMPLEQVGPCNVVTLVRLLLTSALLAPLLVPGSVEVILAIAVCALLLDGVDGWLARRYDHSSEFGARFDMEVDAAFGLILALNAWTNGSGGAAVLLLGLPRYLFAIAGQRWPWLLRPLPERRGRKTVCVLQIAALIVLQVPSLPEAASTALLLTILGALAWSFGRDALWLRAAAA